jgi:alkylation response protein AidB-like acyl-CoA dehydrogenase
LATEFALEDSERDQKRRLPYQELEHSSRSGIWGITVPKEYGGADVSARTLAEVIATISAADSSLGQIPQNHFFFLQLIRTNGCKEQKKFFYERVLQGERLGNALSELGTKAVGDYNTRIVADQAAFILTGRKFYSTGALFGHWIPVVAKDERDYLVAALVERGSAGLQVLDDWDSFGQRTAGSGTVILENVRVPLLAVMPYQSAFDEPILIKSGRFAKSQTGLESAGSARWSSVPGTVDFDLVG